MNRNSFLFALAAGALLVWARTAASQTPPQLQLTARVLEQSYCSANADTMSLQLKFRLRYTNQSSQRLIIYKGHDLFFQTKIRREGDQAGQSYQVHLLNMHYFDEEFEPIDVRSPSKVFVTLAPNESFERELIKGLGVTDASKERSSTSVHPGEHTLQLIVSTWYQTPKLAEQLRLKWQRKGYLWSQPLVSAPLHLNIQKPAAAPACR